MSDTLTEIRKRDAASAETWFKPFQGPQQFGAAGRAFVDRRWLLAEIDELKKENDRLNSLINTPHTHDFIEAVRLEMPHQRERWGAEHDAGKTPADWFWLVGFLAGKALHALVSSNVEKAKHHVITTAAALGNWFLAITGESTAMRPGIEAPKGESK